MKGIWMTLEIHKMIKMIEPERGILLNSSIIRIQIHSNTVIP